MSSRSIESRRRNTLSEDIASTGLLRTRSRKRKARSEDDQDKYVDAKSSQKILKIGQELSKEEEEERRVNAPNPAFVLESQRDDDSDTSEEAYSGAEGIWISEDDEVAEEAEPDPKDLRLFNDFLPVNSDHTSENLVHHDQNGEGQRGTNLTNLILEKIAAHDSAQVGAQTAQNADTSEDMVELPAKVVEVYSKIGLLLSRYKSGKLPKPFKILPTVPRWEELLSITKPESWSANACYEATRIFVSSKPYVVQRFLEYVILDRVREDIHETKRLDVHLYKALQKALFKPAAFFKGFLFPLVTSGTCSLREAHIISSILVRKSIPVLHSAAALLRLTEIAAEQTSTSTENSGSTNVFIKVLLEKKYALPYKVIDALVFHFLRFRAVPSSQGELPAQDTPDVVVNGSKLPVLWHQCLLAFAQRYRNDITEDQREALLDLLLTRGHNSIGPEVRRELLEGRGRGTVIEEGPGIGGDDTMVIDTT